jgi:hypothetical protein
MHNELLLSGVLCKGAISSSGDEEWSREEGERLSGECVTFSYRLSRAFTFAAAHFENAEVLCLLLLLLLPPPPLPPLPPPPPPPLLRMLQLPAFLCQEVHKTGLLTCAELRLATRGTAGPL